MAVSWIGRFFDERDIVVRLLLLDLSGLSYLLFRPGTEVQPGPVQWALAVAAFVLIVGLHRWPPLMFGVQAALLLAAFLLVDDAMINQVGASWALLELTMAARRPTVIWAAGAALCAVYLVFEIGGSPLEFARSVVGTGVVVGLPLLLGLNVRGSRMLAHQAEQHAAEEQLRRESELRAARAGERSAIARELHDVVAHHVASMVLRVAVARHVLPDADPRVTEVFDDVHGTGTTALADLRQLVALLRDPEGVRPDAALTAIEPAALPAALRAAVDQAERGGLTVDADIAPSTGALDAVRGLAVLRLTQEALINVAKHAGPSARARLTVSVEDGAVHLEVVDEGSPGRAADDRVPGGAVHADRVRGGGHGLVGMRERVDVLGGRLEAGPSGSGWRVCAVLPARPAPS